MNRKTWKFSNFCIFKIYRSSIGEIKYLLFVCFAILACLLQSKDVKAEEIGKYNLSGTSVNSNYDVTGDGISDTVQFKKLNSTNLDTGEYQALKVIINGTTALHRQEKNLYYYDIKPVFIQTKDHSYFLITLLQQDYGRDTKIYEYVNGSLKKRVDLDKVAGKLYYIYNVSVSSAKANSFTLKLSGQTNALASTNMSLTYKTKANGGLSLSSKTAKVSYSNQRMKMTSPYNCYKSKYLVSAKKIQAYRNAMGTKKAFTIKKGTKLKITKVSIQGKTPRYYCITKFGKKGWIKSKYGLFKDLLHTQ